MVKDKLEDLEPPTSIDPYATLGVPNTATAAEIRSAYKKLALRLHPDKAAAVDRASAHKAFQDLAFAYAVLSDERRRKRYDATGNTSETLEIDDDNFNWGDYFRTQYSEFVTAEKINEFQRSYKESEEERRDVLEAYRRGRGSLDGVFENVVLSNPLDDEDRFRAYIDKAIKLGEVETFQAYTKEPEKARQRRQRKAEKERQEAEAHAEEIGLSQDKTKKGSNNAKKEPGDITNLASLIQQRNEQRRNNFLDDLLDKYGDEATKKGSKRGKAPILDGPSEEAFAEMGQRKKRRVVEENKDRDIEGGKKNPHGSLREPRPRKSKKIQT